MTFMKRERVDRHDGTPYLNRLIVVKCAYFTVLLHQFAGSDDECHHDHPWWFVTIILCGGYLEWWGGSAKLAPVGSWRRPGTVLYRPAGFLHRIEVMKGCKAVTLVVTGPRTRTWGFLTRQGWVPWSRYNKPLHCP